jgi:ferritin-like metal-binding protein YciE
MTKSPTLFLQDAFIDELRDTYSAELQVTKALPKMIKAATAPRLRSVLEAHLKETRAQVQRLEAILAGAHEKVRAKHCEGMAGILKEGAGVMAQKFDDTTMDACLIAAAQRVEHYEMAAYGTLVAWSRVLGNKQASELLQQTLLEEKTADLTLSALAEAGINEDAAEAGQLSPTDQSTTRTSKKTRR